MNDTTITLAEWVLPGHPDKLCDALADRIVGEVARVDRLGQCGIEVACAFDQVFVTGLAGFERDRIPDLETRVEAWVRDTWRSAGYGGRWDPLPETLQVDLRALRVAVEEGALDVGDRRRRRPHAPHRPGKPAAADPRALVDRRQEAAAERAGRCDRRIDRDEAGQVLVLGAQAVERPGAERGPDKLGAAGVELREGLRVGWQVGRHRVDHAELVGMPGHLVEQARHPEAAFAAPGEFPTGRQERGPPAARGYRGGPAGVGEEFRLVVEGVDV